MTVWVRCKARPHARGRLQRKKVDMMDGMIDDTVDDMMDATIDLIDDSATQKHGGRGHTHTHTERDLSRERVI